MRPTLIPALAAALVIPLGGCGAAHTTAGSGPSLAATTSAAPRAATTTTPPPPPTPDFTIAAKNSGGDRVLVAGSFGPPVAQTRSDADQSALKECLTASDGRALVVRMDLEITVQSGLPTDVGLSNFGFDGGLISFLMGYSAGADCQQGNTVSFHLAPHQPAHFTIWLVLGDAITANNPSPTEKDLTNKYMATVPSIDLSENNTGKMRMGGRRLLFCRLNVSAESYEEPTAMLVVAGAVPKQITSEGSTVFCFTRPAIG
jgi:hypothetical protein